MNSVSLIIRGLKIDKKINSLKMERRKRGKLNLFKWRNLEYNSIKIKTSKFYILYFLDRLPWASQLKINDSRIDT